MTSEVLKGIRGAIKAVPYGFLVRLSLLTMTNPNQLCDVLLFCLLRWLMRPILALNLLLQIEQERSEEESSVGDALALAFRCARFCSAVLLKPYGFKL